MLKVPFNRAANPTTNTTARYRKIMDNAWVAGDIAPLPRA